MSEISRRKFLATTALTSGAVVLAQAACNKDNIASPASGAMLNLQEAAVGIHKGTVSPVELTRDCLNRISQFDGKLNSFITVTGESALADAQRAEHEIANGRWLGPLHGIPIALKDNIDTAGVRTTAASALYAKRVPRKDADVVKSLKAAGAILLGKLNMHEFALGTTSVISSAGAVHNPWNVERVAGGSSGGCGAAVAAHFCFGAIGTDTGGSIRVPASSCGIVGLKPTFDVVSARGIVPTSPSFDQVGPLCRTVADTALLLRAITDNAAARAYNPDSPASLQRPRLGVVKNAEVLCGTAVDAEVMTAINSAVDVLRKLATRVIDVDLPMPRALGELISADLYAFHAKTAAATPELYDSRTLGEINTGRLITHTHADSLRRELAKHRRAMRDAFTLVDLVVLPTLPTLPIAIAEATAPFSQGSCTFEFSLAGLPSISIPCGMSRNGLPIGMLICGPPLSEPRLFALAAAYERVTKWHTLSPSL